MKDHNPQSDPVGKNTSLADLRDYLEKNLPPEDEKDAYRLIFEKHPDPMWIFETDSLRFIAVNDAAVEQYQYSREEFLQMSLFHIRLAEDSERLQEYSSAIRQNPVLATKGTCDRWRHRRKDGSLMDVEVTWRPLRVGERTCVVSAITDITDAQQEIARMQLQTNVLGQVSEAVFTIDNNRRITYWNEAASKLYGYQPSEVLGQRVEDVVRYKYLSPKEEKAAKLALQNEGVWRGEKLHFTKHQKTVYVDTVISTLRNERGAVFGLMAVSRDISEKKRFQKELLETNQTLTAIVEGSPVAIICHDLSGKIRLWNKAAEKIFGWTESDILGKPYTQLVPEGALEEHAALHRSAIRGASSDGVEIQRKTRSGDLIELRASAAPLRGADDTVVGVLVLLSDITEQKRTERELREAKEMADVANRTKSEFVANISHEIRTPLSAILGFAEMMFDAKQTVAERMKCISRIRHNVHNLTELIDDLLDLSKVEAGHFEVERANFSLLAEFSEVVHTLQSQILRKRLGFSIKFEGPIPSTIYSDAARLRQVLLNLIGNAIKFTERGTVAVHIQLENIENPEFSKLLFRVSDTGLGIAPEDRDRIFHPFSQIDSSVTRKFGGTGLGLNLSRRLARTLGGDVVLRQSYPNRGSTFDVTIDPGPLDPHNFLQNVTEADLVNRPSTALKSYHSDLKGMRVLLVEDGQDNQFLLSHFLRSSGAEVDLAVNGQVGLDLARQKQFDLILMDIQMPVLDGYQATSRLREEGNRTPIVALTAHAMKGEKQKCFAAGCNSYLSKPINASTLIETVSQFYHAPPPATGTSSHFH